MLLRRTLTVALLALAAAAPAPAARSFLLGATDPYVANAKIALYPSGSSQTPLTDQARSDFAS